MRLPFMFRLPLFSLILTLLLSFPMTKSYAVDLENTLILTLKNGPVVIELRPDLAPSHVDRIKELTRQNFYDGVVFHRVIDGFMAQTGDPTGTGTGGSGKKLDAEFSDESHVEGTVSMARASDPNSADSQFFIVFTEQPHLDGQYTVWGKVTSGMGLVHEIKKGDAFSGRVSEPDTIITLRVAADVPADELPTGLRVEEAAEETVEALEESMNDTVEAAEEGIEDLVDDVNRMLEDDAVEEIVEDADDTVKAPSDTH